MYLLEDGTPVTQAVRTAFKRGLTRAYIKLGNTIINQDNYLLSTKYKDEKADPETGQFIGITSMRELTVKLYNYENTLNLENQEVEYYVGALVGNEYKYIKFGNFIVQKPDNEEVNEETTFTALDYMIKFDGDDEYVPQIAFPTTLLGLTQDVCRQAGVVLGNTNFRNYNMQILANPFVNEENCRTVLKSIAKLAFSPAYIGQDNKLYIGFNITDSITEEITTNDFFENKPNNEVEPITAITLRSSEVKASGQTHYASQQMIDEYGINELIIEEDYLAYTDTLRNAYLTGAEQLFGLTYKPLTIDLLGSVYLSFNDVIKVTNPQGNEYTTYALNNTHEYNGTLYNTISVPALTETEEKYKYEKEDETYKRKTAIEIDKAKGEITAVVAEIGEQNEKILQITATVDELNSKISDVADITTSQETDTAYLSFQDINTSEPISIQIHPIIQNIAYIYPYNTLYPNSDLYCKTRILRFFNTETNEIFDYELPCDLYYYDAEHYDEFILDYGDGITGTCIVNKKVGINTNGTTYLLNQQYTESYTYPSIPLTDGNYIVSILGYEAGYLFVRLMSQNIYTTQFATKVEMNSAITQTVNEIDLSVDYKLTAYSTTTEMNSAINISRNSILSTVSETYTTKTTTQTLESKIEQKASSIALSVSNGQTTSGITISLEDENGNVIDSKSGTIQMTGLVKFSDLSGSGTTTINGANITTGTISASHLDTSTIHANSGTIAGLNITSESLTGTGMLITKDGYALFPALHTVYEDTPSGPEYADLPTTKSYSVDSGAAVRHINIIGGGAGMNVAGYSVNFNLYASASDPQLKKNIAPTKVNGLDTINKIEHIQFNWKYNDQFQANGYNAKNLESICPDFVDKVEQQSGEYEEILQVKDFNIMPYITKSIQELYQEIEKIKERIK